MWLIGSSIVREAFVRSKHSSFGKDLQLRHLNASILWQAKGGMKWAEVLPKVKHLLSFIDRPSYIIVHCGGNDIGGQLKSIQLIQMIQTTLNIISKICPGVTIIWSQILPRLHWRNEINHVALEKVRLRVNSKIATFVISNGGRYIRYPEIIEKNRGLFCEDGVHLSQLGNDVFIYRIQQALQSFLTSDTCVSPPLGETGPWL